MNRIRELRENSGMKQIDLAVFINVSQGTLSNWERGVHDPDNETITRLADYFNVTTDYILGRTDDPSPPWAKKEAPAAGAEDASKKLVTPEEIESDLMELFERRGITAGNISKEKLELIEKIIASVLESDI